MRLLYLSQLHLSSIRGQSPAVNARFFYVHLLSDPGHPMHIAAAGSTSEKFTALSYFLSIFLSFQPDKLFPGFTGLFK